MSYKNPPCWSPGISLPCLWPVKTSKSCRCSWLKKKCQVCTIPDISLGEKKNTPPQTSKGIRRWVLSTWWGQVQLSRDVQQLIPRFSRSGKLISQVCARMAAVQVAGGCCCRLRFGWAFPLLLNNKSPFQRSFAWEKEKEASAFSFSRPKALLGWNTQLPLGISRLREAFKGADIQVLKTACAIPFGSGVRALKYIETLAACAAASPAPHCFRSSHGSRCVWWMSIAPWALRKKLEWKIKILGFCV